MAYVLAGVPTALAFAILALVVWREREHSAERERREKAFNEERGIWIRERRDLNNRIQIPQAAPYLSAEDDGPSEDDLPLAPEFAVDEDELEKARRHLEAVGYESGPAA